MCLCVSRDAIYAKNNGRIIFVDERAQMNRGIKFAAIAVAVILTSHSWGQASDPHATFAPFEQWKAAILAGDAATLKALYSVNPPAKIFVGTTKVDVEADTSFWLGLKPRSMKTEVVRNELRHGHISYIFRAEVASGLPNGQTTSVTDDQSWQQEDGQWR